MSLDIAKSYQQTSILTADPLKLILMCYNRAIGNLKQARNAYSAQNYEEKGKALQKALNIIDELNASLDMEKGGQIAANLRGIYHYLSHALINADLKKDMQTFDDAIQMLEEIQSAWKIVAEEKTSTAEAKYNLVGTPYRSVELGAAVGAHI